MKHPKRFNICIYQDASGVWFATWVENPNVTCFEKTPWLALESLGHAIEDYLRLAGVEQEEEKP